MQHRPPRIPRPDRIRQPRPPFAWLDCRLLLEQRLAELTPVDMALYLFWALAANRDGVSYYHLENIARRLGHLDVAEVARARDHLETLGLIAFEPFTTHDLNGYTQVLELPSRQTATRQR